MLGHGEIVRPDGGSAVWGMALTGPWSARPGTSPWSRTPCRCNHRPRTIRTNESRRQCSSRPRRPGSTARPTVAWSAGVAQGLANHLAVKPLYVRIALRRPDACSTASASWSTWRSGRSSRSSRSPRTPRRAPAAGRSSAAPRVALVAVAAGGLLLARGIPILGNNILLVPLLLAGAGLAVLWSQADKDQRDRWRRISLFETEPTRRSVAIVRFAGGAILVAAGVGSFLLLSGTLSAARDGLVAGVAVLAGLALLTAPLWWRLVADLTEERRERIRSQERAELAAHLHDSVLHTLALIQRNAGRPREVARLARGQERELRTWLYQPGGPARSRARRRAGGGRRRGRGRLRDAGGDRRGRRRRGRRPARRAGRRRPGRRWSTRPSTPGSRPSRCTRRSSRTEVTRVRPRPRRRLRPGRWSTTDRHGVRGSIIGRMERHGGKATIRSTPGEGTEVELTMHCDRGARDEVTEADRGRREAEPVRVVPGRRPRDVPRRGPGRAGRATRGGDRRRGRRGGRGGRRDRPRPSRTWCCSTCTCPTAAAGRCWTRCAAATRRCGSWRCRCPTPPRT